MSNLQTGAVPNPADAGGQAPTIDPVNSNQAGNSINSDQSQGDTTDWRKRYSDSTSEYQKMKKEYDRYKEENETYSKIGLVFSDRYVNDPEFKEFVDKKYGKEKSDGGTGAARQGDANPNGSSQQAVETPEQAWAREKMTSERKTQGDFYMRLEGEDSEKIDKYNTRLSNGEVYNPIRTSIGTLTRALMQEGMPFEKAATTAYTRIMKPEVAIDEAKLDGLVEGLVSNSVSFIGGGNSRSKAKGDVEVTGEDAEILRTLGIDPSSDDYRRVAGAQ